MATSAITSVNNSAATNYLVVPGQLIAVSTARSHRDNEHSSTGGGGGVADDSFLRGHGTYLEVSGSGEQRLYAAVTGIVQRVNKLISVETISLHTFYRGQVGDLIVGRIISVGNTAWKVDLGSGRPAILPLQGVHLPGGVQRVRTAADALDMRSFLQEGDLVSAEVHKVGQGGAGSSASSGGDGSGTLRLHTRSIKYGKLENGCLINVPPSLIPRRKNHYIELLSGRFQILLGCNGMIWVYRNIGASANIRSSDGEGSNSNTKQQHYSLQAQELVELQEQRRHDHANMPYSKEERQNLARIRNAVECLRIVQCLITTESIERIYHSSYEKQLSASEMLSPDNVISLTEFTRTKR